MWGPFSTTTPSRNDGRRVPARPGDQPTEPSARRAGSRESVYGNQMGARHEGRSSGGRLIENGADRRSDRQTLRSRGVPSAALASWAFPAVTRSDEMREDETNDSAVVVGSSRRCSAWRRPGGTR
jgi:hypothetical protein